MNNEFEQEIKAIEQELLNLKTSQEYSSTRSAQTTTTDNLSTGLYRIEYVADGIPILSTLYPASDDWYCKVYGRTPGAKSQIIEVMTTYWDNSEQTYIVDSCPITIISNVPVKSITRIS